MRNSKCETNSKQEIRMPKTAGISSFVLRACFALGASHIAFPRVKRGRSVPQTASGKQDVSRAGSLTLAGGEYTVFYSHFAPGDAPEIDTPRRRKEAVVSA
jgi:hypothetical protein